MKIRQFINMRLSIANRSINYKKEEEKPIQTLKGTSEERKLKLLEMLKQNQKK